VLWRLSRAFGDAIPNEFDKAIADYSEAIRLNPNASRAYVYRGRDWADQNEYGKTIADYDRASRIDPNDSTPRILSRRMLGLKGARR
jgi:tetratricopeptide (TPR) repeat protein